jgi:YHS domain-containing protein
VGGPRKRLEALGGDRLAAAEACPEGAVVKPPEGGIDELQVLLRAVAQREVALLLEDLTCGGRLRSVRHLARRLDLLAELSEQARALGVERGADGFGVERRHRTTVRLAALARQFLLYSWGVPEEVNPMAMEIDPVCGMEVDTTTSLLSIDYDGTTYWFCGKGCMLDFQDDPPKYLDPEYTPSM